MASSQGTKPSPPFPAASGRRPAGQAADARTWPAGPVPDRQAAAPAVPGDVLAARATEDIRRKVVVAEALRALSPAHRQVLNETILRGRTVNDAAAALGIPAGTVKARVYYALHALRAALAERGLPATTTARCP